MLCTNSRETESCEETNFFDEFSLLPVVLVFISQFVLGIGNTLYYSLGNTYMDDNTKKTSTPMLLGLSNFNKFHFLNATDNFFIKTLKMY